MTDSATAIESGKQRGVSRSLTIDSEKLWCDAAIQKHDGVYKAHVSVIRERNMDADNYELYFTRSFSTLKDAVECINSNGHLQFDQFSVLRGNKIFNPEFDEEITAKT